MTLRLAGVSRRFGALTALHPLDLTVADGERHALIGPNGAGKTTVVNLITGRLRPTTGTIGYAGAPITRLPPHRRARLGIGRTFQHPAVHHRLTLAENVALAVRGRRGRAAAVHEALARVGLDAVAGGAAGALSYGERRLLELAVALAGRPRLLLLDEPTAGLAPDEVARVAALIAALPAEVTVLLIDHNLDVVFDLADTVTVLDHGERLTTGPPDVVRADPTVRAAYLAPASAAESVAPPAASALRGEPVLRVRGLQAGYAGSAVLRGIDLDAHPGEVVVLLGRNGAGKTTLLNTIAGVHTGGSAGTVLVGGRSVAGAPAHVVTRSGLGLVPQGRRLFASLTVAEHLATGRVRRSTDAPQWSQSELLELLPALARRLGHRPGQLSGGEQQLLALARALAGAPRVLLLDEPSEGLAPLLVEQLGRIIARLAARGVAVLLAEHHLALAARVAHRVVVLGSGRVAHTADSVDPTDERLAELLIAARPARSGGGLPR